MASDDKGDIPRLEPMKLATVEDVIYGSVLPVDRYHLQAPTFLGEDVEHIIAEFSDVAAICRWPAKVTLIQLWLCLTEAAEPYVVGQDVGDIFDVLRARFRLV